MVPASFNPQSLNRLIYTLSSIHTNKQSPLTTLINSFQSIDPTLPLAIHRPQTQQTCTTTPPTTRKRPTTAADIDAPAPAPPNPPPCLALRPVPRPAPTLPIPHMRRPNPHHTPICTTTASRIKSYPSCPSGELDSRSTPLCKSKSLPYPNRASLPGMYESLAKAP